MEEAQVEEAQVQSLWTSSTTCLNYWGNYCGPGYCNAQNFSPGCSGKLPDISTCNTNGPVKDALDTCCRTHDACCIKGRATNANLGNCDRALVACSSSASCGSDSFLNLIKYGECVVARDALNLFFADRLKLTPNSGC